MDHNQTGVSPSTAALKHKSPLLPDSRRWVCETSLPSHTTEHKHTQTANTQCLFKHCKHTALLCFIHDTPSGLSYQWQARKSLKSLNSLKQLSFDTVRPATPATSLRSNSKVLELECIPFTLTYSPLYTHWCHWGLLVSISISYIGWSQGIHPGPVPSPSQGKQTIPSLIHNNLKGAFTPG